MTIPVKKDSTPAITNWHVVTWKPHNDIGEVAGIMDEAGKQQAVILSGPDGLRPEDIERANLIARAVNNHANLLKALKRILGESHNPVVERIAQDAIEEAKK